MNAIQIIAIIIAIIMIVLAVKFGRFRSTKLGSRQYAIKGNDDVMIVYAKGIYFDKIEILFEEITAVGNQYSSSIETKGRSVIGRAIVGGVVAGGVGAIIGGMSGLKDKEVRHTEDVLYIETKDGKNHVFVATESTYDLIIQIQSIINKQQEKESKIINDNIPKTKYHNQKVICDCGNINEIHFTYCRSCGKWIDLKTLQTTKNKHCFKYYKCPLCNKLTPTPSGKCKHCVNCGTMLKQE